MSYETYVSCGIDIASDARFLFFAPRKFDGPIHTPPARATHECFVFRHNYAKEKKEKNNT